MSIKISIIVGFRNREIPRVKNALESLKNQTIGGFELIFVDYGSTEGVAQQIRGLVESFSFARYLYSYTAGWCWNRAHALNTGIKFARGEILLFYDIDLIIENDFLKKIAVLEYDKQYYTFSCFYLPSKFDIQNSNLLTDGIHYEQNYVGLCSVTKSRVFDINGFDEFYMVWGVEDDDFYERLTNVGLKREQLQSKDFKIFHQWHSPHAPSKPDAWYLTMVDYLFSKNEHREIGDWGIEIKKGSRPLLKFLNDNNSENSFVNLKFWEDNNLLFYNSFLQQFHSLRAGMKACIKYNFKIQIDSKGNILQTFLDLFRKDRPEKERIEKKDIVQFFQFFIGVHRRQLLDYYFHTDEKSVNFYFIKQS